MMDLKRAYQWDMLLRKETYLQVNCGRKRYKMNVSPGYNKPLEIVEIQKGEKKDDGRFVVKVDTFNPTNKRECLETVAASFEFDKVDPEKLKTDLKFFYLGESVERNIFCFLKVFVIKQSKTLYFVCRRTGQYGGDYIVELAKKRYIQYLRMHEENNKVLKIKVKDDTALEKIELYNEFIDSLKVTKNIVSRLSSADAEEFFIRETEKDVEEFLSIVGN